MTFHGYYPHPLDHSVCVDCRTSISTRREDKYRNLEENRWSEAPYQPSGPTKARSTRREIMVAIHANRLSVGVLRSINIANFYRLYSVCQPLTSYCSDAARCRTGAVRLGRRGEMVNDKAIGQQKMFPARVKPHPVPSWLWYDGDRLSVWRDHQHGPNHGESKAQFRSDHLALTIAMRQSTRILRGRCPSSDHDPVKRASIPLENHQHATFRSGPEVPDQKADRGANDSKAGISEIRERNVEPFFFFLFAPVGEPVRDENFSRPHRCNRTKGPTRFVPVPHPDERMTRRSTATDRRRPP